MPVYYLSYADERGGKPWLRILGVLAAMLIIGLVAAGIWWWATGDDGSTISVTVGDSTEAVPFADAIPTVYQANTNTLFLVDISGSIAESGNLKPMRTALASIALGDAHPDIHTSAENSQAALMTSASVGKPPSSWVGCKMSRAVTYGWRRPAICKLKRPAAPSSMTRL